MLHESSTQTEERRLTVVAIFEYVMEVYRI